MTSENQDAFSYPVKVGHISANPVTVRISADPADLQRLSGQWQVPEVRSFKAEVSLGRWKRDGVRVRGHVSAAIVQDCVVTLEPLEQQIEEDKNTLAPDKLPSSFGGHQAAVAGTSTKKHACKNR